MSDRTIESMGLRAEDREDMAVCRAATGLAGFTAIMRDALHHRAEGFRRATPGLGPPATPAVAAVRAAIADDGERLRLAVAGRPLNEVEREIGVGKGVVRNCLRGLVSLEKAGGGKVLEWVEATEGKGKAT